MDDESFWVAFQDNFKSQLAGFGSEDGDFFWKKFFDCFIFVSSSTSSSVAVFGAISIDMGVVWVPIVDVEKFLLIKEWVLLLVSLVRLSMTTDWLSNQGGELSCMEWWMLGRESSASFSIVFMWKPKGFIDFSLLLKSGSYFGLKI